jgi:hypothetical protein
MPKGPDLGMLAVRFAAIDVVTAYAMALDACDWVAFRNLFEEEIDLDYSSLGSLKGRIPAQAWVDRCKVLGGFDATQHKVSNFVVEPGQDAARVTCYVDAAHFIGDLAGFACGTYVHELSQHGGVWKIRGCAFTVAGYATGRAAFDAAFDAARAARARRSGAPR